MPPRCTTTFLPVLALLLLGSRTAAAQCPDWTPGLGSLGTSLDVYTLAVYDDGAGPALHVGGTFKVAGNVKANRAAKWDGSTWSALIGPGGGAPGNGLTKPTVGFVRAYASAVFDDGSGPALVVGGHFERAGGVTANHLARWDGFGWSPLGSGVGGGPFPSVWALAVFNDGSGPALYAGGSFTFAGGTATDNVARWDGVEWTSVGTGLGADDRVASLAVFDDGSGPALFAGGDFTSVDGVAANHVARWDGSTWTPLGAGLDGSALSLAMHDDGTGNGPALFVGGAFTTAAAAAAPHVARWDGSTWSAVGTGFDGAVETLLVYDEGAGARLFAGGAFAAAGAVPTPGIARWNGAAWSSVGGGIEGPVHGLAVFDEGAGLRLFVGGAFREAGGGRAHNVARWDGSAWGAVGDGDGLPGDTPALATHDDGSGPALYAGSRDPLFGVIGVVERWQGTAWSTVGGSFDYDVLALASFDSGGGDELYAGGNFTTVGASPASRLARWNGAAWVEVGGGINTGGSVGTVNALAVFDDGTGAGPALIVGGDFGAAGGVAFSSIAAWDGASWSPLSNGLHNTVLAMEVFDDGSGPALYVGGSLNVVGGVSAKNVARWDGTSWTALGPGLDDAVRALAFFDDGLGAGPQLVAGGAFLFSGSSPMNRIARWNGSSWTNLKSGMDAQVRALEVFDDGRGEALFATGGFDTAGGNAAKKAARWDGTSWSALGSGLNAKGRSLAAYDDPLQGPGLFAGGAFVVAGGVASSHVARWAAFPGCGPRSYCTAGTSASGCAATLSVTGAASATAPSGLLVSAATVEGGKDGLFFFGTSGRQANPWGNGSSYQCVIPPVKRAGLLTGTGTSGLCDGSFSQDLNAHWSAHPNKNPRAGTTVQAQLWYRDPLNTSSQTTSLSDAVEFDVGP